jgi:hypothetical protein
VHNSNGDLATALRWYENTRRRKVRTVSRVASLQISHSESVLRPGAAIPDRLMTWALTTFLRWVSHRQISAEINRDLGARGRHPVFPVVSTAVHPSPQTSCEGGAM